MNQVEKLIREAEQVTSSHPLMSLTVSCLKFTREELEIRVLVTWGALGDKMGELWGKGSLETIRDVLEHWNRRSVAARYVVHLFVERLLLLEVNDIVDFNSPKLIRTSQLEHSSR